MAPYKTLNKKEQKLQQMPWISGDILNYMHERDELHKIFLAEKDIVEKDILFNSFKKKRNKTLSLIRKSKDLYFKDFFESNKADIKNTWKGIKNIVNLNKKQNTLPDKLVYQNKTFDNDTDIAKSFNTFFTNIGNTVEAKIPTTKTHFNQYLTDKPLNSIFINPVTEAEIANMIADLSVTKSSGPYSIPSKLLKYFCAYFTGPLETLINKSLSEGNFPGILKLADVCPIFKKNDKNKCENYRPISLLPNIRKLYERAMHSRVYDYFEKFNLLYESQFGFRKKHSTNHAILSIVEDIHHNLDNNNLVCGVFIDLEKAFDTVNHDILIKKLDFYGIRGISNKWFKSYLSNRKQRVKYKNTLSKNLPITCGVPQGSILGPLLFLIYINDMNKAIKNSSTFHFADDTYLKFSCSCERQLRKTMNKDLQDLFTWLCANRLSLNVAKTEFIIFKPPRKSLNNRVTLKLNGKTLYESKKIKYLGLIVDDRLSWKFHINELCKKLGRVIGIIYRLKKTNCPKSVLLCIYSSLFQSQLCYGIMAWGSASKNLIEKLYLLQKKAIRIISNASYTANSKPLFKELDLLNIWDLFEHQVANFMFDFDHGTLPDVFSSYFVKVKEIHSYNTRSAAQGKLSSQINANTVKHGDTMLQNIGVSSYNKIVGLDFYKNCRTKKEFSKKYKTFLVTHY